MASSAEPAPTTKGRTRRKLALLLVVIAVVAIGYWQLKGVLSFDYLAQRESDLRSLQEQHPMLVAGVALATYVVVAGLSLPGALVMTLACGWYFGFWKALLIVSFGSTAGATIALLLSRYFVREWVQKTMGDRLAPINEAFERKGAFYLFTLRLIAGVPFFVVNAIMGLTQIRAGTFWWVSQLGMLPGTAAYVYAGSAVPSLQALAKDGVRGIVSWQLLSAFGIVGLLPLIIKKLVGKVGDNKAG